MGRVILLVIDGLGIGAQEDAGFYGDEKADTLGHICEITKCNLPNFRQLGLGNIRPLESISPVEQPAASWGKMREISAGKDSTTGHWELAGIHLESAFPTFLNGFPDVIIKKFCEGIGRRNVLCNKAYSGTDVLEDFGTEHMYTGFPIVYTSADSVFQVAAHIDIVEVETLYKWCEFARKEVLINEYEVGRVIARPFTGTDESFERLSEQRKDYSSVPPKPNLLSVLQEHDIKTYSIGKVIDLFAGSGFTQYRKTKSNAEGISQLLSNLSAGIDKSFVFVNLIDTDQIYGHRQDPEGYAECLMEIDRAIPALLDKLKKDDLLMITGDHGNDPADDSTDHTREFVPLLVYMMDSDGKDLGIRETFADVSVTTLEFFGIEIPLKGTSFYSEVV